MNGYTGEIMVETQFKSLTSAEDPRGGLSTKRIGYARDAPNCVYISSSGFLANFWQMAF